MLAVSGLINKTPVVIKRKLFALGELCKKQKQIIDKFDWGQLVMEYNQDFWKAIEKLVAESELVIDRPRGSHHPRYYDLIYPVDYGYLKGTTSMDGDGIDVWKGTSQYLTVDAVICTVDLKKKDSEIKLLLGCSEEEKKIIYEFHNNDDCMKGILIERQPFGTFRS